METPNNNKRYDVTCSLEDYTRVAIVEFEKLGFYALVSFMHNEQIAHEDHIAVGIALTLSVLWKRGVRPVEAAENIYNDAMRFYSENSKTSGTAN